MTSGNRWGFCPLVALVASSALVVAACGWEVLPIGSQQDHGSQGGVTAGSGQTDTPAAGAAAGGGDPGSGGHATGGADVDTPSTGGAAVGGSSSGARSPTGGTPSGGASTGGRGTGGGSMATGGADTGGVPGTGGRGSGGSDDPSTGGRDAGLAGTTGEGGSFVQGGSGGSGNSAGQTGLAGTGGSSGGTGGAGGSAGAPACEEIGDLSCDTDGDCCLVLDECWASLVLVTSTYAAQMQACFAATPPGSTCPSCIPAAVQTWCDNGQCVGQVQTISGAEDPLTEPHCGRIDVSGAAGSGSGPVPAPAGAPLRKFGCG
ncbi:MAG: hypothetical protein JW940_22215 [Polyangiaceae bacterium]|nr:hypothetical protein [Polyangiaceae bacterium]